MKILIIDPTSSGKDLVSAFRSYSNVEVDVYYQDQPFEVERANLGASKGTHLLKRFAKENYDAVLAGSESGVTAADWLAAQMGLPGNSSELLWHRRNKAGMIEVADQAGLRTPRTWVITSSDDIELVRKQISELANGVVVKPSGSAGSDSCFICPSLDDAVLALNRILGADNLFGSTNREALIQERILGPQFFVNAVSGGGQHVITEIFEYGIDETTNVPHIHSAQTVSPKHPLYATGADYGLFTIRGVGVV